MTEEEDHMTDQTNWKPGDVANNHILIEGEGWVPLGEHARRVASPSGTAHQVQQVPMPPTTSNAPLASPPSPSGIEKKTAWYRKTWAIAAATAVVGLILGIAIGGGSETPDPKASPEYQELSSQFDETQNELQDATEQIATIEGSLPDREAALTDGQAQLVKDQKATDDRAGKLKDAEAAVARREKAVGIVETTIENNTVPGEGMFLAGKEIKAGTYKTAGRSGCYYAVLNSTDTFDIAVNGNINGPGFLTIAPGQYLESTRCADWILQ